MAPVGAGRVLNIGPSPAREDDHTPEAAEARGHLRAVDPPERVDLRADWYSVGDQGMTGSCVGWALADSVMWRQLVAAGRLEPAQRLSPRFMWMAAKEMRAKLTQVKGEPAWRPTTFLEQGMTDVKSALDVARLYGAALERELPFDDGLFEGPIDGFYASAARRRVTHYYRLDPDAERDEWLLHWRRWIAQHGPVLVVINVDDNFIAGAHVLDAYRPDDSSFNHAAALVGYSGRGFLIRCSWGGGWGQDGYAVATDAYLKASTIESYGVVV
jgi:Papain family cysteine protease